MRNAAGRRQGPAGFQVKLRGDALPKCPPMNPDAPEPLPGEHAETHVPVVRVEPLGGEFDAPPELTLLEAASFAGIRLPRLCRNGTCRTCLCRVVSGEIGYTIEWPGLSREEKAEGYVLTCVAVARTDLVLDVPDAEFS